MSLSLPVAMSGMKMLARLGTQGFLEISGVSEDDFKKLVGDAEWIPSDRGRMTEVLHTVINGSMDAQGLPRIDLPAEYIAAGIVVFVSPCNVIKACHYMTPARSSEAILRQGTRENIGSLRVSPELLFTLCQSLYDLPLRSSVRAMFEKRTGILLSDEIVEESKKDLEPQTGGRRRG